MTGTTKATYSCHGYELSAQESTNPIHFGHGRDGAMIQDQGFLLAIPIVFFFFSPESFRGICGSPTAIYPMVPLSLDQGASREPSGNIQLGSGGL